MMIMVMMMIMIMVFMMVMAMMEIMIEDKNDDDGNDHDGQHIRSYNLVYSITSWWWPYDITTNSQYATQRRSYLPWW